jgi:hypothetical protein
MTKIEGMTNDQMPGGRDIAFLLFGFHAFFVIPHSCFVISAP